MVQSEQGGCVIGKLRLSNSKITVKNKWFENIANFTVIENKFNFIIRIKISIFVTSIEIFVLLIVQNLVSRVEFWLREMEKWSLGKIRISS